MKRLIGIILSLMCAALTVVAQENSRETTQMNKEERQKLAEITLRTEEETRVARAELEIIQAQLKRLLLSADADLGKIERLLSSALEWELQVRLAEIRRELQIRQAIGDRRWAQYVRAKEAQRAAASRTLIEEQTDRLYAQLTRLTGEKREDVAERIRAAIRQALTRLLQSAAKIAE
jgi:hypothetical protein